MIALPIVGLAFATLFGDVSADFVYLRSQRLPSNSTIINDTSLSNVTARALATPTTTVQTIYTSLSNSPHVPPRIKIMDLTAVARNSTGVANYFFEFAIEPDPNLFTCSTSISSPRGTLSQVPVAYCQQNYYGFPLYNSTMPAKFTFAWKHQRNGTMLILRSTNPASANHCPDFPHDACWAQALYWISPDAIRRSNGVEEYVHTGPPLVEIDGAYCKSGMPECVWTEYLY